MVIAFANQKGGVGKTCTTLSVGASLARSGRSVLLVDLDPQGHLSASCGCVPDATDSTTYELLKGTADANTTIVMREDYDLIPADIRLAGAELELAAAPGRDFILREALAPVQSEYDYILLDCPPALAVVTLMGLTAARWVVIPVQAQYLALNGLSQLNSTISVVQRRLNPELQLLGVLITMYDKHKLLDQAVMDQVQEVFTNRVFRTTISTNVKLAEAPAYGKDIFQYQPNSKGALQYEALTQEIISQVEKGDEYVK